MFSLDVFFFVFRISRDSPQRDDSILVKKLKNKESKQKKAQKDKSPKKTI